ncbi:MAG: RnfABCDGE type electron transport complex subunit B [Bacteroidota bacterium]
MSNAISPSITVKQIDDCLPQTQCTQCGYPRCRAYAEAIAQGEAGINQCPPGNAATIRALAALLGTPPTPLDPRFGAHAPRARAVIDETLCIGCRKCLDVCPVDAIVGTRKLMHTVIAADCTGCGLCLPPCPVNCIALPPVLIEHARRASGSPPSPACGRGNEGEGANSSSELWPDYTRAETGRWRALTEKRQRRLARRAHRRPAARATLLPPASESERIRAEIRAAVERVSAKRRNRQD